MHLKRDMVGKFWPVPRKGTKYLAVASHEKGRAIPLVVVLRDVLKIIDNKKELKKLMNENKVLVNNKFMKDTNFPILLFDVISFPEAKKYFKAVFSEYKKIVFEEISEKESLVKIYRVQNKKIIGKDKIQINLLDGRNLLTKDAMNVGDSVVYNSKDNKVEKILVMKDGSQVVILKGKYLGLSGTIENIEEQFIKIKLGDKENFEKTKFSKKDFDALSPGKVNDSKSSKEVNIDKKNLMVIE